MLTNMHGLACGACGYKEFRLYDNESSNTDPNMMVSECVRCKSTTIIKIIGPPRLTYQFFDENSEGILCHLTKD